MNYRMIRYILGRVLQFEAIALLLPLICSLIYKEHNLPLYIGCIVLSALCGFLLTLKKPTDRNIYAKEGFVIVSLAWIFISLFGAFPFFFSGHIPNFIDALFETVSGFTTTGASILTDVEALPKSLIMWRSFTHWIGGMGVLVFLIAILPGENGGSNMYLVKSESTGPSVSKLVPKAKSTAKILYTIYSAMTLIEVVFLLLGGMTLFESLTLSFGTAGTGGFAINNAGIGAYSSYVQIVITIFMILFGVNFSLYYLLLIKRFRDVFRSDELKAYFGIIATSIILITVNAYHTFDGLFDAIKHSAFQVGSIITTTGFGTVDFNQWPEFSKGILLVLMFVGAMAGSTGGGMKVSRILVLIKSMVKELRIMAHPKRVYKINMDGRPIAHETVRSITVYSVCLVAIFAISLLIISLDNFNFETNFSAVAATINNIGPGFDAVGPTQNFSIFSPLSKLVMIFDMLAGRLEIFPILALFSRSTWKK